MKELPRVQFSNNCTCIEPGRRVIYLLIKKMWPALKMFISSRS